MSPMNKMIKMLDSVRADFSVDRRPGTDPFIWIRVPGDGYNLRITFTNDGDYFSTATVHLDDELSGLQAKTKPATDSDDYTEIVNMVKDAPVKNGQYQEAKSQDGKYIGLLYQDFQCEFGVAFVCLASTKKFLGVVGY